MFTIKAYIIGIAISAVLAVGIVISLILAVAAIDDSEGEEDQAMISGEGEPISEDVKRYEDEFKEQAEEHDIEDQVDVLLALTMQESSGSEQDVMQSSESQGDSPGEITDPKKSIEVGVEYYADLYEEADGDEELTLQAYNMGGGFIDYAEKENDGEYSQDLEREIRENKKEEGIEYYADLYEEGDGDEELTLQAYNMGGGFIDYAEKENEGEYSQDLAKEFSEKQKSKNGSDTYGDPEYVEHVKKYIDGEESDSEDFEGGKFGPPLKDDLVKTSGYGKRDSPGNGVGSTDHRGIDFDCSKPDKIISVHDGEIFKTGSDSGGWGNYVVVKNSDDEFSLYGHMSDIDAKKGDTVKEGDNVGVCGETGGATGEHLHLEYWDSEKALKDKEHRKDP